MAQNEELFYDDEDAVKYIRKNLDAELTKRYQTMIYTM